MKKQIKALLNVISKNSCVMCHMLCVKCHMSRVTTHMSSVTCHIFFYFFTNWCKLFKLVGGGSLLKGAYPVYFFLLIQRFNQKDNEGRGTLLNIRTCSYLRRGGGPKAMMNKKWDNFCLSKKQ